MDKAAIYLAVAFAQERSAVAAAGNDIASVTLCLAAVWLGSVAGQALNR